MSLQLLGGLEEANLVWSLTFAFFPPTSGLFASKLFNRSLVEKYPFCIRKRMSGSFTCVIARSCDDEQEEDNTSEHIKTIEQK